MGLDQLIAKFSMTPTFNLVEKNLLLDIIEKLRDRISSLEIRLEEVGARQNGE
jgi:hypothetical protein